MKTVVLHGSLRDLLPAEYNGRFECDFATAREAISALEVNFGKVFDRIRTMLLNVVVDNDWSMNEKQVVRDTIVGEELHVYPAVEGAGGGKGWTAILGVALIAVAVVMTGGIGATVAGLMGTQGAALSVGASMALKMGTALVLSALVQPPKIDQGKTKAGLQSSTYSGPINTQDEGATLPYVAGRNVLVGGVIIHTDLQVEKIANKD